jgi:hypothetical protein
LEEDDIITSASSYYKTDAFSKFQEEKYNFAINENKYSFICFSPEEIEILKEIEKIEYAFNSTIDNSSIDSVGGFFVKCALNTNNNYEYLLEHCLNAVINFDTLVLILRR